MRFFQILVIIAISISIIATNLLFLVFDKNFYNQIYSKQLVQPIDKKVAQSAIDNLLGYFRGQNTLEDNFFSNQAKTHLKDVKSLLDTTSTINILSIFVVITSTLILVRKNMFKGLKKSYILGSTVSITVVINISLLLFLNFDFLFIKFHQLIFRNNLWLFDPNDNLIKLFPEEFFIAFANRLFINIILSAILIIIFAKLLINNDKSV